FGIVEMIPARGDALLRLGHERRHAAVRRIDDERRLLRDAPTEVPPEIVIGAFDVGGRAAIAAILVRRLDALLRELLGFFVRHRVLAGELARPLERRELREVPRALQIRTPVRGAWDGRRFLRLRGERRRGEDEKRKDERARAHGAAPFEAGPAEPLKSTTRQAARLRIV